MLKRTITATIATLLLVLILVFGKVIGAAILFAVACAFSTYEMLTCCNLFKKWYISIPSILFTGFCALLPAIVNHPVNLIGFMLAVIPFVLICFLFATVVFHKSLEIESVTMFFAMALYITAGFASLTFLAKYYLLRSVVFVFAVACTTDIFAYFCGSLFGKRKLCPTISPKKTVAGAIGGSLFGILAGGLVLWFSVGHNPLLLLIPIPLTIIGQLGDLSASLIKRKFGVKDYGRLFPGHGGVLDRFDSIIPIATVTALFYVAMSIISML